MILILTIIGVWVLIGAVSSILSSWINNTDLDYSTLFLSMICGVFSTIIHIWYAFEDAERFPKWMYKNVIEHIK